MAADGLWYHNDILRWQPIFQEVTEVKQTITNSILKMLREDWYPGETCCDLAVDNQSWDCLTFILETGKRICHEKLYWHV